MLTSFDGTRIYAHFMPAVGLRPGERAATILQAPGLLLPGATNLNVTPLDGIIADTSGLVYVGTLRAAGYNVVTWDPRGENSSGGRLEQGSPEFDAKDVSAIISWVATQPEARLDPSVLDPRIGMTGASYGGGIQLVSAATDPRIDAIVPAIAWNTLNTATYKNQAFKSSWASILTAGITLFTRPNPAILPATIFGVLTGRQTAAEQDRLAQLGPGGPLDLVGKITAPTLLIQGTVDTLFSLQEADSTAQTLIANGVPTKVIWFCGGHGLCANDLFDPTDGVVIQRATLAWLDRYVNGNTTAVTGPQFEFVDQRGQFYASDTYSIVNGSLHRRRCRRPAAVGAVHRRFRTDVRGVADRRLESLQRAEPHDARTDRDHRCGGRTSTDAELPWHRHRPARVRTAGRRFHRNGAGQPGHAHSCHPRRSDALDQHPARTCRPRLEARSDRHRATGGLVHDLRHRHRLRVVAGHRHAPHPAHR